MRKVILVLLSIAILSACSSKPSTTGKTDSSKDKVTLEEAQSDSQESTSNELITEQSSAQDNQTQPSPSQEVVTGGGSASVTGGDTSTYTDSTTVENPPMDDETANRLIIGNNNDTASTSIQGGQKVILNVSQQYQQTWNWCAPTAVSMILSYKGVSVSQA